MAFGWSRIPLQKRSGFPFGLSRRYNGSGL
jgi:hypothetical protein